MAKQRVDGGRGRRPGVVTDVKRGGPGRGFWLALGIVAVIGLGALGYVASRPKVTARTIDPNLPPMKAEGYLIGSPTAPVRRNSQHTCVGWAPSAILRAISCVRRLTAYAIAE